MPLTAMVRGTRRRCPPALGALLAVQSECGHAPPPVRRSSRRTDLALNRCTKQEGSTRTLRAQCLHAGTRSKHEMFL